jgi:putative autotransporter adhesin-like protein
MSASRLLLPFAALAALLAAAPAWSGTVIPVGAFDSVALRDGGHVILRHGAVQRVTLLQGSTQYTSIRIDEDNPHQLVIDSCRHQCPHEYRIEVEIVTPDVRGVSVSDGGSIESAGGFPQQGKIAAAVEDGGKIDIRSIAASEASAAVNDGGKILLRAQSRLAAAINDGGEVVYWGDPRVSSAINDGGSVEKGS